MPNRRTAALPVHSNPCYPGREGMCHCTDTPVAAQSSCAPHTDKLRHILLLSRVFGVTCGRWGRSPAAALPHAPRGAWHVSQQPHRFWPLLPSSVTNTIPSHALQEHRKCSLGWKHSQAELTGGSFAPHSSLFPFPRQVGSSGRGGCGDVKASRITHPCTNRVCSLPASHQHLSHEMKPLDCTEQPADDLSKSPAKEPYGKEANISL